MFALRNTALRASKAATRASAVKQFSISASALNKREVIAEKKIPVADYTAKEVKRTHIPVRDDPDIEVPQPKEEKSRPLTRELYNKLPKSMQKQTVMDKVVIVTG